MEIREATEADIPEIVSLLKISLGETLMPKSEAFWRWKHVANPFGKSRVLVAEENYELIGVRAFMRWEWKHGDKIYKAVRAVDTATHPQHQGRGIFKKLTLTLVDKCKGEGVDFVFNTPNKISKPGYLKMGWETRGKLPVAIRLNVNFGKRIKDFDSQYLLKTIPSFNPLNEHNIVTNASPAYLKWRYTDNPNVKYYCVSDYKHYVAYFRLKRYKFGIELRICDAFFSATFSPSAFRSHVFKAASDAGASLITFSGKVIPVANVKLRVGPEVTVRSVSANVNFLTYSFWSPSLGDMEVF